MEPSVGSSPLGDDDDFNYDNNGVDWEMGYCNHTTYALSPYNVTHTNITDETNKTINYAYDWAAYGFSFVPEYRSTKI